MSWLSSFARIDLVNTAVYNCGSRSDIIGIYTISMELILIKKNVFLVRIMC